MKPILDTEDFENIFDTSWTEKKSIQKPDVVSLFIYLLKANFLSVFEILNV